jgi:hypothetical protein
MKSMYLPMFAAAAVALVLKGFVVESRPTGAGSCVGGKAAVGGFHLDYGPKSNYTNRMGAGGTLEDAKINFKVSFTQLDPNTNETFDSFAPLIWELESPQIPFQGILVRVLAPEDIVFENIGNEDLLKEADACNSSNVTGNVVGVTHRNTTAKSYSSGTMVFAGAGLVTIDVTVVFRNDENYSIYAYSNYTIEIASSEEPSDVPSAVPSILLPPEKTLKPSSPVAPVNEPSSAVAPTPDYAPVLVPKKTPEGKGMSMDKCLDSKGGMMMSRSEKKEGKGGMMMGKDGKNEGKGGMMMSKGDDKVGKGRKLMGKGDDEEGKGGMMMGKGYYDECEYASDAPSDSPSASPTATPSEYPSAAPTSTPRSSKKGKGGMMSAGKGGDDGMMGKGGKSDADEAPAEEEPSKGKDGMGMDRLLR